MDYSSYLIDVSTVPRGKLLEIYRQPLYRGTTATQIDYADFGYNSPLFSLVNISRAEKPSRMVIIDTI